MKPKQIFIPTALVASALSTISYLNETGTIIDAKSEPGEFGKAADAAVSGSAAQAMIRNSIATISRTIRFNDELLGQQYSRLEATHSPDMMIAGNLDTTDIRGDPLIVDSTHDDRLGDTINCYTNCHNACHGSRGWR